MFLCRREWVFIVYESKIMDIINEVYELTLAQVLHPPYPHGLWWHIRKTQFICKLQEVRLFVRQK